MAARRVVGGTMRSGLPTRADLPIQVELEGMSVIGLSEPVLLEIDGSECRLRQEKDEEAASDT